MFFELFDVFFVKEEEVYVFEFWWRGVFVVGGFVFVGEEFVEEFGGVFYEYEIIVFGVVGGVVKEILNCLYVVMVILLVYVFYCIVLYFI